MTSATMPSSVPLVCSSPSSHRTPQPAPTGAGRPLPPATQPVPEMTRKNWVALAGWVPTRPPAARFRHVTLTWPSPAATRVARSPRLPKRLMFRSRLSNWKTSTGPNHKTWAVASFPTLVVVSGPAGSGKTTLAHLLAAAIGCPAVSRDEIKEGMVHATPGFVAGPGDKLSQRTLPVFFGVLELLLRAGVTTVAEAAFQDHVWRPRLEPLAALAEIRIVQCVAPDQVAFGRQRQRHQDNPVRRAHDDPQDAYDAAARPVFSRVSLDVPTIEVDTTDGYRPSLNQIVAFAGSPA
jgi:predicted kinase